MVDVDVGLRRLSLVIGGSSGCVSAFVRESVRECVCACVPKNSKDLLWPSKLCVKQSKQEKHLPGKLKLPYTATL